MTQKLFQVLFAYLLALVMNCPPLLAGGDLSLSDAARTNNFAAVCIALTQDPTPEFVADALRIARVAGNMRIMIALVAHGADGNGEQLAEMGRQIAEADAQVAWMHRFLTHLAHLYRDHPDRAASFFRVWNAEDANIANSAYWAFQQVQEGLPSAAPIHGAAAPAAPAARPEPAIVARHRVIAARRRPARVIHASQSCAQQCESSCVVM